MGTAEAARDPAEMTGPSSEVPDPAGMAGPSAEVPDLVALTALASRLQATCLAAGLKLATAESCTGGLVSHVLTEVPGSSGYFAGGIVAYSDAVKEGLLDVPAETLARHGAVSAQAALAMAGGARTRLAADLALAVTGIAGPEGGTPDKPVGLTYVAVADDAGSEVERHVWSGTREANKRASAAAALELGLRRLGEGSPS